MSGGARAGCLAARGRDVWRRESGMSGGARERNHERARSLHTPSRMSVPSGFRVSRRPRSAGNSPRLWPVFLIGLLLPLNAVALPPPSAEKAITSARTLLGTPYVFGGRSVKADGGV